MSVFALGSFTVLPVVAASGPSITSSSSNSCVLSVTPCTGDLTTTVSVSKGETVVVSTNNYVISCGAPAKVSVVDSFGDKYVLGVTQAFQFAGCNSLPAINHQY